MSKYSDFTLEQLMAAYRFNVYRWMEAPIVLSDKERSEIIMQTWNLVCGIVKNFGAFPGEEGDQYFWSQVESFQTDVMGLDEPKLTLATAGAVKP